MRSSAGGGGQHRREDPEAGGRVRRELADDDGCGRWHPGAKCPQVRRCQGDGDSYRTYESVKVVPVKKRCLVFLWIHKLFF